MKRKIMALGLALLMPIGLTNICKGLDGLYSGEPASKNFVVRWAFQKMCPLVYDPWTTSRPTSPHGVSFDPKLVKAGDVVFVRKARKFFKEIHPHIKHPYIIIGGGAAYDRMELLPMEYLDDPKIIAFFGIHPSTKTHRKYHPIPLGIQQDPSLYRDRAKWDAIFMDLRKNVVKKQLLYLNFSTSTDFVGRGRVRDLFENADYCKVNGKKPFRAYLTDLAESKFTLSPAGTGPDCYRTWESLLVGSIPIVLKSQCDPLFEDLPVLIVNQWEDINEQFLNEQYKIITSKKYDIKKLYIEYWFGKISHVRDRFLAKRR